MGKTTLFCFPYAGGSRYSYRKYEDDAPTFLEIVTIEYPGRGARFHEPLLFDIHSLVNDLYWRMKEKINGCDYAIYGHSMGGLVGYLLARKMDANDLPAPKHLFVTGTNSPASQRSSGRKRHLLGKREFIEDLKKLNGCPDEILEDKALFEHYLPIIRADMQICENYVYEESYPLKIPITVITGSQEEVKTGDIQLWQNETIEKVDFRRLPGGHFFISQYHAIIMEMMIRKIYK